MLEEPPVGPKDVLLLDTVIDALVIVEIGTVLV